MSLNNIKDDFEGPEWLYGGRIPSLDGLRALSVLLVLLFHGSLSRGIPIPKEWQWFTRRGAVGVDIFFAISGFLISTLLFREWERTGGISLLGFYSRRTLRIIPPLATYLLFVFALCGVGMVSIPVRDWIAALTYTVNFFQGVAIPFGHLWSLSVEEHFYLLWPLVVFYLGPRRAGRVALVFLACEPVIRWTTSQFSDLDINFITFTRLDSIAGGSVLAIAARGGFGSEWLRPLESRPMLSFLMACSCLMVSLFFPARFVLYNSLVGPTVNAICICVLLWLAMRYEHLFYGKILNWRPLTALGAASYSLYLWQQVFLDWHSDRWYCKFPQNFIFVVIGTLLSYFIVEVPTNFLKNRIGKKDHVPVAMGC